MDLNTLKNKKFLGIQKINVKGKESKRRKGEGELFSLRRMLSEKIRSNPRAPVQPCHFSSARPRDLHPSVQCASLQVTP